MGTLIITQFCKIEGCGGAGLWPILLCAYFLTEGSGSFSFVLHILSVCCLKDQGNLSSLIS